MPLLQVRTLGKVSATQPFDLTISLEGNIAALAAEISKRLSVSVSCLRLCYNGTALLDGASSLKASGISEKSFVVALVEPPSALTLAWKDAYNGDIPSGAVRSGAEADGTPLYVARVAHGGGAHPGKACKALGGCRAGYGGQELCAPAYQVLVATDSKGRPWPTYAAVTAGYSALPSSPIGPGGRLAENALVAGYESDGTPLYAAVARDPSGGVAPGKVQRGWEGASVGFGGSERNLSPAHVLCVPEGVLPPPDDTAPPVPQPRLRRYITCIDELLAWTPATASADLEPPSMASAAAPAVTPLPGDRPRVLHCHDMKGGYCAAADEEYLAAFSGWASIDAFCYFSHQRVSLPPQCWIDACHARGIPVMGTLITEGPAGRRENSTMLAQVDRVAERLAELAATYGFDGWLINIEAPLAPTEVAPMVELLQLLTICTKQAVGEHALVLYYDSLDAATGRIAYQNALTPANMPFFDACDGIFTNYWWDAAALAHSAQLAGARRFDVFAGVDCFARGPGHPSFVMPYGAGPACAAGVQMVANAGISLAVFAPGWSLECGEACNAKGDTEAAAADARFWEALGLSRVRRL